MKLKKIEALEIIPTAPFAFDATFHKPDHFSSGDNLWEPGVRWQTWNWQGKQLGLKFINDGSIDTPHIRVDVYSHEDLPLEYIDSLAAEMRYRYNLDMNLSTFYSAFSKDHVLGPLFKRWRGMRPGHPSSLYEYLIIGIVLQNATVRRSIQMFQALLENYGTLFEFDGKSLWCFWQPGDLQSLSNERVTEALRDWPRYSGVSPV